MVDELTSRRSGFRPGREILLADGQLWTFPAPTGEPGFHVEPLGSEYLELIRAILQAEDSAEQRLAELALAIFLLGNNYQLSSAEFAQLFSFPSNSPELTGSQRAFHDLAQAHVRSLSVPVLLSPATRPGGHSLGGLARLLARLRSFWPIRLWSLSSHNGEAVP